MLHMSAFWRLYKELAAFELQFKVFAKQLVKFLDAYASLVFIMSVTQSLTHSLTH